MIGVTTRQGRLLSFIRSYTREHGYAPSIREMAKGLGRHNNALSRDIDDLEDHGFIRRRAHRARSIEVFPPLHDVSALAPVRFGEEK